MASTRLTRARSEALEEGVDAPEVGLFPVVFGVVVALGALDLLAEEEAGGVGGEVDGAVVHVGEGEVDRAIVAVVALGGDEVVDGLAPGFLVEELAAGPGGEGFAVDVAVLGAAADQVVGPEGAEILGVVGMLEQGVDQGGPLVGVFRGEEGGRFRRRKGCARGGRGRVGGRIQSRGRWERA